MSLQISLQEKRPAQDAPAVVPLMRAQALAARREPLHGPVMVAMPPGASAAGMVAVSSVVLLALASWLVEVPQRTRAVGVLMPPGGFVRIVAPQSGRIAELHVREGERVEKGQRLVRVTSDGGAVNSDSVPHARLQSLQAELNLQEELAGEERLARARRAQALDLQIGRLSEELRRAVIEVGLHEARVELLAQRLARLRSLAAAGNVPGAALEEVRLDWLSARAGVEALRRQTARIEQEGERLKDARAALALEAARERTGLAIARERIARELRDVESQVGRELRAPRAGVVARLTARPGQPVEAGQALATVYSDAERLEAWLYLPSTQAGSLREGQPVELRFDAWPSHVFGTQPGTIASISAIALMPSDLDVPLALPGPVFEIRATLESRSMTANGRRWPLAAGTAVRADLVQQRYRLYEWLMRIDRSEAPPPGDA